MDPDDEDCSDLIIPLQTFCFNESLQTIIFEERRGHTILFHTQATDTNNNFWAQESIGSNAGRGSNDFRGEPFLQTLILPNQCTTLLIQDFAFRGNSRAAMYLTDTYGTNMYGYYTKEYRWPFDIDKSQTTHFIKYGNNNANLKPLDDDDTDPNIKGRLQWNTIGDESVYGGKNNQQYYGYCFAPDAKKINTYGNGDINTYNLNQKIPYYDNIYYHETINFGNDNNVEVEVGKRDDDTYNSKKLVFIDKCAYVCEQDGNDKIATMTKYMYTLHDEGLHGYEYKAADIEALKTAAEDVNATEDDIAAYNTWLEKEKRLSTARVKEYITLGENETYKVTKIGPSAFSACYCDGTDFVGSDHNVCDSYIDLAHIIFPNTIERIEDYAFIRTYALEDISSYTGSIDSATIGMPSSLKYIGKNAFIFSEIKEIRNIPYDCVFYENTEDYAEKTPSVFSNAVSLRIVTFVDENGDENATESLYYLTTTYVKSSHIDPETEQEVVDVRYTSAVYSKAALDLTDDDEVFKTNEDRLLLVLNRDYADREKTSEDVVNSEFNGQYAINDNTNPFLFGAYKMGYWITKLKCGLPTEGVDAQPLICAVGTRGSNTVSLTKKVLYLGTSGYTYDGLSCVLKGVSGDLLDMPQYAFNGCENIATVELPYSDDGRGVPTGLFKGVKATITSLDSSDESHGGKIDNVVIFDMSESNINSIGNEAFRGNTSLQQFIAPKVDEFTIGQYAFEGCKGLQVIDLRNVKEKITIDVGAFNNAGQDSSTGKTIIYFPEDAEVIIKGSAFNGCTKLKNLTLPKGLTQLGASAFKACNTLATVTCDGDLTGLTSIGSEAFASCTSLDSFDFAHMTALTSIGSSAFNKAYKTGATGSEITIPSTVTSIGENAFKESKITALYITSSSMTFGPSAFSSCTSLETVRFLNDACDWEVYNAGIFDGCTSLTTLHLPSSFLPNNSGASIIKGADADKIHLCLTTPFTSSTSATNDWRIVSNLPVSIYWYLTEIDQLKSAGEISDSDPSNVNTSHFYWTYIDDEIVRLEHIKDYSNGVVRFSTGSDPDIISPYILTENGFSKVYPITYNGVEYVTDTVTVYKDTGVAFSLNGTLIHPNNVAAKDSTSYELLNNNLKNVHKQDGTIYDVVAKWTATGTAYLQKTNDTDYLAWFGRPSPSFTVKVDGQSNPDYLVTVTTNEKYTVQMDEGQSLSVGFNSDELIINNNGTTYVAPGDGRYTVTIDEDYNVAVTSVLYSNYRILNEDNSWTWANGDIGEGDPNYTGNGQAQIYFGEYEFDGTSADRFKIMDNNGAWFGAGNMTIVGSQSGGDDIVPYEGTYKIYLRINSDNSSSKTLLLYRTNYYKVVGVIGGTNYWPVGGAASEYYLDVSNTSINVEEYTITIEFDSGDEVKVYDGTNYFPTESNYSIDVNGGGEGTKHVYFRPNHDGGDDWFYHYIYMAAAE